jgi:hypothetical protein
LNRPAEPVSRAHSEGGRSVVDFMDAPLRHRPEPRPASTV